MNKKGALMHNPQYLLLAFVTLILGIALLDVSADLTQDITTYNGTVAGESFNINRTANATVAQGVNATPVYTLANDGRMTPDTPGIISAVEHWNGSAWKVATADTDYNFSAVTGELNLINTSYWLNLTDADLSADRAAETFLVNYTYALEGYLEESWARSTMETAMGLFALALLGVSVALFFLYIRDWKDKF